MPEPAKLESAPPTTVILEEIKAVEAASLRVKVMVAVWPDLRALLPEVMVMEGTMVSTVMEIVLEAVLLLPAVSVKVLTKTLMKKSDRQSPTFSNEKTIKRVWFT